MEGSDVGPEYRAEENVWRSDLLHALVEETEEGSVARVCTHQMYFPTVRSVPL